MSFSDNYFSDSSSDILSDFSDTSSLSDFDPAGYSSEENVFDDQYANAMKGGEYDSQDHMGELEDMMGGYSIGGDNNNSKKDKITRNFVIVEIDGVDIPLEDGGDYTIATHKRDPKTGEMVERKSPPHPGDAARKAFSAICKKKEYKNKCKKGQVIRFKIRETTRGRPKTVKAYTGKIVYFKKPKVIEFKRKDKKTGKVKKVKETFRFKPEVKRDAGNKSGGYYYS